MKVRRIPPAARFRSALPWIVLAGALAAAPGPVWSLALLGFDPSLDDLLSLRCFGTR